MGKLFLIPQWNCFSEFYFIFCVVLMIVSNFCVAHHGHTVHIVYMIDRQTIVALPASYTYMTFPTSAHYFTWKMWHILYGIYDAMLLYTTTLKYVLCFCNESNSCNRLQTTDSTWFQCKNIQNWKAVKIWKRNYLSLCHRDRLYDRLPNIYRTNRNSILIAFLRHRQWNSSED